MALKIVEFFGYSPLDPKGLEYAGRKECPFVKGDCVKPRHGACSVQQIEPEPVICCPNRLYANKYLILADIAHETFGGSVELVSAPEAAQRRANNTINGNEVAVFGRYWGQELPLPRPSGGGAQEGRKYYVDWILAKLDKHGKLLEFTAVEVQTIDTTGNYSEQSAKYFAGKAFKDAQGRLPGFSSAGMNWENVNKRILPQLIYKGHVLRREERCSKGLFFVCPKQVYSRISERLGGKLHKYKPGNGTVTFRSYELGAEIGSGRRRSIELFGQFTTTVDQVALAFTSAMNLPDENVYELAINAALSSDT